jgi:riboflavin transporter
MSAAFTVRRVAIGAVFGGLAFTMGFLPLSFPFPPIPYLKFDLAEIPAFLAAMVFGPSLGLVAAFSHFISLLFFGEWSPIGPLMKFLAVASSLAGFWLVSKLVTGRGILVCSFGLGVSSILMRVVVMTVTNYIVLVVLLPDALEYGASTLSMMTGLPMNSFEEKLSLVLLFTALYNGLHIPVSMIPSYIVAKSISPVSIRLGADYPWIVRIARANGRRFSST